MCDLGITMAVTGIVATLFSTAMGTVSAVQQSNAQEAQANYQRQVAEENAKIAKKEAAEERQAGIEEARNERIKALQEQARQKVGFAANGMEIAEGSALDTLEDTAMIGELNALNVQYNREQRAINYEQQASNFENEANLQKFRADNAKIEGMLNAGANVGKGLSSVANTVSSSWGDFGKGSSNKGKSTSGNGGTAPKGSKGYLGTLPKI